MATFAWHRATDAELAACVPAVVKAVEADPAGIRLSRFEPGSGFRGPSRRTTDDFHPERLLERLVADDLLLLLDTEGTERPSFELVLHRVAWRTRAHAPNPYDPELRAHEVNLLGGLSLNLHGPRWTFADRRRLFRTVVQCTPALDSAILRSVAFGRFQRATPVPSAPVNTDTGISVRSLGLAQYISNQTARRLGISAAHLTDQLAEHGDLVSESHGGIWLDSPGRGDFDPAEPAHRDWFRAARMSIPLPEHRPITPPQDRHEELHETAVALVRKTLGQPLLQAHVLQHYRGDAALHAGHGPLRLAFSDGTTFHTWPAAGNVWIFQGPGSDRAATWPHPSGATDQLRWELLGDAPVGQTLNGVHVGAGGWFGSSAPFAWEFNFGTGRVLCAAKQRGGPPAAVERSRDAVHVPSSEGWSHNWHPIGRS